MMNKPNCTVGKRKQIEVIINRYDKGSKGRFKLYREKVIMEILEYQEQKSINTKDVKKWNGQYFVIIVKGDYFGFES